MEQITTIDIEIESTIVIYSLYPLIQNDIKADFYGNKLGVAFLSGEVGIYNTNNDTLTKIQSIKEHIGPVSKIDFSHPKFGTLLLSGGFDKKVILSKITNSTYEKLFEYEHNNSVSYVTFSKNLKNLIFVSASIDGDIAVHLYINDTIITKNIQGHSFGVNSVSFNPKNENQFISCGNDNLIKKWETKNDIWVIVDKIETDSIMKDIAYSDSDKESFASCSEDGSIILWTKEGNEWAKKILGINENVEKIEWNENYLTLIAIDKNGIQSTYSQQEEKQ